MPALSWSARPPIAAVAKGPKPDILELGSNVAEVPFPDLGFRSAAWIRSPLDCSLLTERGRIVERRLAAILGASVVGYSRLIGEDEAKIDASEQSAGNCRRKPIGGVTWPKRLYR